jgi:hypothetical protein
MKSQKDWDLFKPRYLRSTELDDTLFRYHNCSLKIIGYNTQVHAYFCEGFDQNGYPCQRHLTYENIKSSPILKNIY